MLKVCIDPGHGGKDKANKGKNGYVEAIEMLKLAKLLEYELKSKNIKTILTRYTDTDVSLQKRANIAYNFEADLFLSLHSNAGGGSGTEIFRSIKNTKSEKLGILITTSISNYLNVKNRGVKTKESTIVKGKDYYTVLNETAQKEIKYSYILELLFHDNEKEEKMLLDYENVKQIAKIISNEIVTYFNININYDFCVGGKYFNSRKIVRKNEIWVPVREFLNNLNYEITYNDNKKQVIGILK